MRRHNPLLPLKSSSIKKTTQITHIFASNIRKLGYMVAILCIIICLYFGQDLRNSILENETASKIVHAGEKVPVNAPNALKSGPWGNWLESSSLSLWGSWCNKPEQLGTSECEKYKDSTRQILRESNEEMKSAREACITLGFKPCKFFSQQDEDAAIFNMFFRDQRDGTYLELGALDGTLYSNTRFLEETMGWSGVLIEASPPSYEKLAKSRFERNILVNRAVCPKKGLVEFLGIDAMAGMVNTMPENLKTHNSGSQMVECEPLRDILHRSGTTHIDFWSLDVEGAELGVLQSMDWSISVHILLIERNVNDIDIEVLLVAKGFEYVREQRGNRMWAHSTFLKNHKRYMRL